MRLHYLLSLSIHPTVLARTPPTLHVGLPIPTLKRIETLPDKPTTPTPSNGSYTSYITIQCDQLSARNSPMLDYVAKILTAAGIKAKDLQDLEEWTHSDWKTDANDYVSTKYFSLYIPRLQEKNRIDHIPRRRKATDTHHGTAHVFPERTRFRCSRLRNQWLHCA